MKKKEVIFYFFFLKNLDIDLHPVEKSSFRHGGGYHAQLFLLQLDQ